MNSTALLYAIGKSLRYLYTQCKQPFFQRVCCGVGEINSFVQGCSGDERKWHSITWYYSQEPKNQGGMGFFDLHLKLIRKLEGLWVRVVRGKYRCR